MPNSHCTETFLEQIFQKLGDEEQKAKENAARILHELKFVTHEMDDEGLSSFIALRRWKNPTQNQIAQVHEAICEAMQKPSEV